MNIFIILAIILAVLLLALVVVSIISIINAEEINKAFIGLCFSITVVLGIAGIFMCLYAGGDFNDFLQDIKKVLEEFE